MDKQEDTQTDLFIYYYFFFVQYAIRFNIFSTVPSDPKNKDRTIR